MDALSPGEVRLCRVLFLSPGRSFVAVGPREVEVRLDWAFRCRFPRAAVASAEPSTLRPLSRGAHGLAGRWLVNGSGAGLVLVRLAPPQRAMVAGFRARVQELHVSADDPAALLAALRSPPTTA
jgi:hypothetical protein